MLSVIPRLLVFDLDGTLIDSRADLCQSVNATLAHFGERPLPESIIAGYIGDGAEALVRRSLAHAHRLAGRENPYDETSVAKALRWFLDFYRVHKLDFTTVYPGVLESLAAIRAAHPRLPMAVLTNKPVRPSREICTHFGMDRYFFQVAGGDSFPSKKPDPQGLEALIAAASAEGGGPVRAKETVLVGDSPVDVQTALRAGTQSVGCLFGLSPGTLRAEGADALVESAWEWQTALRL